MMELASNLVAGGPDSLPASPVMFLFSGAEEPLCQVRYGLSNLMSSQWNIGVPASQQSCSCSVGLNEPLCQVRCGHVNMPGALIPLHEQQKPPAVATIPSTRCRRRRCCCCRWLRCHLAALQSAAAFMSSSSWASRVGVFINLESIGPGGSPIVFQHAGGHLFTFSVHSTAVLADMVDGLCHTLVVLVYSSTWSQLSRAADPSCFSTQVRT
jgi:hypothetical protein